MGGDSVNVQGSLDCVSHHPWMGQPGTMGIQVHQHREQQYSFVIPDLEAVIKGISKHVPSAPPPPMQAISTHTGKHSRVVGNFPEHCLSYAHWNGAWWLPVDSGLEFFHWSLLVLIIFRDHGPAIPETHVGRCQ